jgi:CRP-like cAMP-binding protein
MWTLADDIEHVLAHRDPHDWYVFEAASWALAEQRMPAERRRELWLEPLPAAEMAARLRTLPLFAGISVDELFRISGAARQVRHQPGTLLLQEGSVPETIHVLLDGRVTASGRDSAPFTIEAPAPLGFVQALQGVATRRTIRTVETTVTLAITVDELRTLLADNTDLVRGLFSTLADRVDPETCANVQSTESAPELQQIAADGVLPVERILALQRVPVFARIAADEMGALAGIAQTVMMTAGTSLFSESAPVALWLILAGELSLDDPADGTRIAAGPGDVIGSMCMLSGRPLGKSAAVVRSGAALRVDRDELFELLGERPELLRQLFEGMFRIGADAAAASATL